MKKMNAFTMPELMLTIGIIGMVAILIIPVVVETVYETELISLWKRSHAITKSAWGMVLGNMGGTASSSFENTEQVMEAMSPYLNINNDCVKRPRKGCPATYTPNFLSGGPSTITLSTPYILADGSFIFAKTINKTCTKESGDMKDICSNLYVDVNGSRGPNTLGKDVYVMNLRNKTASPFGAEGDFYTVKNDCLKGGKGWSCATQNLYKLNMQDLN